MALERPSVGGRAALAVALLATVTAATALGTAVPAADRGVPAGTAPVTRPADARIVGPGGGAAGWTVATGDVNGDGVADLVVGAPEADAGAGAVYVVFGPVRDGRAELADADVTLVGAAGDRAGYALAVDDLDGDGVADVAVGAPGNDAGGPDAGAVYVVPGSASLSGSVDLGAAANVLTGAPGDRAGWSVATVAAGAGADLLVGAPHSNLSAEKAGAVYRLDGGDLPGRATLNATADRTLVGVAFGDKAGWAVAGTGDVDGDGRPDVVVGAKSNDTAGRNAGVVYVVVRHGNGTVPLDATGPGLVGAHAGEIAGFDVAGAGDVDGDGLADVLVGAPLADVGGENAGAAYLVRGGLATNGTRSLATAALAMHGEDDLDRAGWTVAGGGDLLGCDGRPDPLVGATWHSTGAPSAGAAYVVSARTDDPTSLGDATTKLVGDSVHGGLGGGLAAGADLDGDGTGDLVVSAPRADTDEPGVTYVLDGDCPATAATPTAAPATASPTATSTPTRTSSPTATASPTPTSTASPTASPTETSPTRTATPTVASTVTDATSGGTSALVPVPAVAAVGGGTALAAALLAFRRFG